MKFKIKHIGQYLSGYKVPRKAKKVILGLKRNQNKLRRLLKLVTLGAPIYTMYEVREIRPYLFCPKCGCTGYSGSGNMTAYPEHWEYFRCWRCNHTVGYIDNSPFIHALECADNDYDPVF